jgi:hypothetical protein
LKLDGSMRQAVSDPMTLALSFLLYFVWIYKYDARGIGLLATSLVSFGISYIRCELRTNFGF